MTLDGRRPLVEEVLWLKTTFDGKRPLIEDEHRLKTTFDGRQSLMRDTLWIKTIFFGRLLPMGDDLRLMASFNGRCPLIEDDLKFEDGLLSMTTFDGRQLLMVRWPFWRRWTVENNCSWKTTYDERQLVLEDDLLQFFSLPSISKFLFFKICSGMFVHIRNISATVTDKPFPQKYI